MTVVFAGVLLLLLLRRASVWSVSFGLVHRDCVDACVGRVLLSKSSFRGQYVHGGGHLGR